MSGDNPHFTAPDEHIASAAFSSSSSCSRNASFIDNDDALTGYAGLTGGWKSATTRKAGVREFDGIGLMCLSFVLLPENFFDFGGGIVECSRPHVIQARYISTVMSPVIGDVIPRSSCPQRLKRQRSARHRQDAPACDTGTAVFNHLQRRSSQPPSAAGRHQNNRNIQRRGIRQNGASWLMSQSPEFHGAAPSPHRLTDHPYGQFSRHCWLPVALWPGLGLEL